MQNEAVALPLPSDVVLVSTVPSDQRSVTELSALKPVMVATTQPLNLLFVFESVRTGFGVGPVQLPDTWLTVNESAEPDG